MINWILPGEQNHMATTSTHDGSQSETLNFCLFCSTIGNIFPPLVNSGPHAIIANALQFADV
jgi:hypothetical protein